MAASLRGRPFSFPARCTEAICPTNLTRASVAARHRRLIRATLESMPVWSRASRANSETVSTEKKAEVSVGQGHPEGSEEFRKWLSGLKPVTGADTMLRFTKTPEGSIDLTHAHPSGLAQLMAGRRTRLSTLIRDRQQYVVAARASRNLRSKIFELANDRGIDAGYLSAGTVVWTSAVGGKPQRVSAPVMLTAVSLTVRPGEDDYELQLTEQARINPALIRHLKTIHGIVFDVNAVTRMAYSTGPVRPAAGPGPPWHPDPVDPRCGHRAQPPGLHVRDLSGNLDDPWINQHNPLVASLGRAPPALRLTSPSSRKGASRARMNAARPTNSAARRRHGPAVCRGRRPCRRLPGGQQPARDRPDADRHQHHRRPRRRGQERPGGRRPAGQPR